MRRSELGTIGWMARIAGRPPKEIRSLTTSAGGSSDFAASPMRARSRAMDGSIAARSSP